MNDDDEGPGMFASRAVWIGALLGWPAVFFLGWLLSKVPM